MSTWYEDMAKAVRKREIALAGLARWQEKVAAAEAEIEQLSSQRAGITEPTLPTVAQTAAETEALLSVTPGASPFFASAS